MHFNKTIVILVACVHLFTHFVNLKSDKPFTAYSLEDRAEMVELDEEYPDVIFFNCRGYFSGVTPCAEVGGNYFSYGY